MADDNSSFPAPKPGYDQPNGDGQRFMRKHVAVKYPAVLDPTAEDPNSEEQEDIFTAANVPAVEREKNRLGYDPGKDIVVYESSINVGDVVHVGYDSPTGRGYTGKVVKIEGETVRIVTEEKTASGLFKTFEGLLENTTLVGQKNTPSDDGDLPVEEEADDQSNDHIMYGDYAIERIPHSEHTNVEGLVTHVGNAEPGAVQKLAIPLDPNSSYGDTVHIRVTNTYHPDEPSTDHSVYQSDPAKGDRGPIFSVRSRGTNDGAKQHVDTHNNVIVAFLRGRRPDAINEDFDPHVFTVGGADFEASRHNIPVMVDDEIDDYPEEKLEADPNPQDYYLALATRILRARRNSNVVDDNSDDATGLAMDELPRVEVNPTRYNTISALGPVAAKIAITKEEVINKAYDRFIPEEKRIDEKVLFEQRIESLPSTSMKAKLMETFANSPVITRERMLSEAKTAEGLNALVEKIWFN